MAARAIFRTQRPVAVAAGLLGATGVGLWVAKSYFTNNAFAESPEPPTVFSSWFGQSLKLGSSEVVNHNTKRLRFEFPNEDARSGLVLTSAVLVMTWPKGKMFPTVRPYTPVSSLHQRGAIDLLVKKYPNGKASTYLHSLSPGDTLYFLGSLKSYYWTPNRHPQITLIAGGAGITPMYQLIQGILHNPSDKTRITLVFGINSEADVLFKEEFEEFEREFGRERFRAVYAISGTGMEKGREIRRGYVTRELLEREVGRAEDGNKVFVCGPPGMESSLLGRRGKGGILEELGYRKEQVHRF
ncbi:NADH-cytochrome b5 reductase-like protein [Rhexocercosporidium sp. MPI-PUGE-AT-0058]|nr:NADH-cytochrome b5 reductase-like protein [Rhexocercosporidium sp. MPI-PUGE-AT-0058]